MAIKIKCPSCAHEMSIKSVKAGRFKPTCTSCQTAFALIIGEGDVPAVKVCRLSPSSTATASANLVDSGSVRAAKPNSDPEKAATLAATMATASVSAAQQSHAGAEGTTVGQPTVEFNKPTAVDALAQTCDPTQKFDATQNFSGAPAVTVDNRNAPTTPIARSSSLATRAATGSPAGAPMPERLGGYRIVNELGRGGMGSVYLARQLSLDRQVAVKTIQNDWANNPRVVARFIREAYAAAQLTHHNVVQIYDLGQDQQINYFSMELIEGGSLEDLLKRQGRLKPNEAATYILHAARGLKFAHDHGMIHRDIKPANLMLTRDCLVKVADLGLVKTPSMNEEVSPDGDDRSELLASARSHITGAGSTMGTPAYMSPEQAEDSTSVDHRADIYSLGCTFYALLVGKPPYGGMSAIEILSKVKTEPIARVDKVVTGVPGPLANIIEKMTDKNPERRHNSLGEVIAELEAYLASSLPDNVATSQRRAELLAQAAQELHAAPAGRLRGLFPVLLCAACGLGVLLGAIFSYRLAIASLLPLLLTPILISGLTPLSGGRSPISSRLRAWILGSQISDWLTWGMGAAICGVVMWALGMLGWTLLAIVLSVGAAAAYFALVLRPLAGQQQAALAPAMDVLRQMRLEGKAETAIAQFVAEFSGKHWEELFERLFDYDLMRSMRRELTNAGKLRDTKRFQPWRDAIVDRMEASLARRRQDRERRVLAKIEAASLKATGLSGQQAEQQAAALAESMVTAATQTRLIVAAARTSTDPNSGDAAAKRERIKQMLNAARSGKPQSLTTKASRVTDALLERMLGSRFRFLLGALLITASTLWASQNGLLDKHKLAQVGQSVQQSAANLSGSATNLQAGQAAAQQATQQVSQQVSQLMKNTEPLKLPFIGGLFTSLAPGVIGLLILGSALGGTWRLSLLALLATGLVLLGPAIGIPALGFTQGSQWISCGIGILLLCLPIVITPLR